MQILELNGSNKALEIQAQKTASTIRAYREQAFARCEEIENLEDLVYCLLGKHHYEELMDSFEDSAVLLLRFLSVPEVAELSKQYLKKRELEQCSLMLYNLYNFFKNIGAEQYRTLMELKYIETEYAGNNLMALLQREKSYAEKLKNEIIIDNQRG